MTCVNCGTERPFVNLIQATCPECWAAIVAWQYSHQVLSVRCEPAAPPESGLVVVDIPRGNAGRLVCALARRRKTA